MNLYTALTTLLLFAGAAIAQEGADKKPAAEQAEDQAGQTAEQPPDQELKPLPPFPEPNTPLRRFAKADLHGLPLTEHLIDLVDRVQWISPKPDYAEDLAGKVVVVELFATWCEPCKVVKPKLEALAKNRSEYVEVILIGGDGKDSIELATEEFASGPTELHYAWDGDYLLNSDLGVEGIPHALVIDTDGFVRWQGYPVDRNFLSVVEQIIQADPVTGPRWQINEAVEPMTDEQRDEVNRKAREFLKEMRERQQREADEAAQEKAEQEFPEPSETNPGDGADDDSDDSE